MKCEVMKNNNNSIFCETYNCRNRAKWFIGNPQGPRNTWINLCDECLQSVYGSMPDSVKPAKVYKCDYCGEEFLKPIEKATHMRTCKKKG